MIEILLFNQLETGAKDKIRSWCTTRFFSNLGRKIANCLKLNNLSVAVIIVGSKEMRKLNKQFRRLDKPTDVLSFEADKSEWPYFGEILICPQVAQRAARRFKRPLKKEISLLFVHGVLHLLGYTHERATKRKEMFSLQSKILDVL